MYVQTSYPYCLFLARSTDAKFPLVTLRFTPLFLLSSCDAMVLQLLLGSRSRGVCNLTIHHHYFDKPFASRLFFGLFENSLFSKSPCNQGQAFASCKAGISVLPVDLCSNTEISKSDMFLVSRVGVVTNAPLVIHSILQFDMTKKVVCTKLQLMWLCHVEKKYFGIKRREPRPSVWGVLDKRLAAVSAIANESSSRVLQKL